jgi:hypothetical protein
MMKRYVDAMLFLDEVDPALGLFDENGKTIWLAP